MSRSARGAKPRRSAAAILFLALLSAGPATAPCRAASAAASEAPAASAADDESVRIIAASWAHMLEELVFAADLFLPLPGPSFGAWPLPRPASREQDPGTETPVDDPAGTAVLQDAALWSAGAGANAVVFVP